MQVTVAVHHSQTGRVVGGGGTAEDAGGGAGLEVGATEPVGPAELAGAGGGGGAALEAGAGAGAGPLDRGPGAAAAKPTRRAEAASVNFIF